VIRIGRNNFFNVTSQIVVTQTKDLDNSTVERVLIFETCVNAMMSVIKVGGAIWAVLGVVKLASSLKDKNGPNLQTSIWQIFGGMGVMVISDLFKIMSLSDELISKVLFSASKLGVFGGILFSIWGVILLAESLRNMNSPLLENGIWQIVGGILISYASNLLNKIIISIGLK